MVASSELRAAVARLSAGGLVAYPTETVWGLGAIASMPAALERLRDFKGRREEHAMSLLIPTEAPLAALRALGAEVSAQGRALVERHWPGPLTLVFPSARGASPIGVRCSPHPVASALASALLEASPGKPWAITSTSCNRTGERPATTRSEALRVCEEGADAPLVIGGMTADEEAGGERPSTVLDLSQNPPRVLREGSLSEAQLLNASTSTRTG